MSADGLTLEEVEHMVTVKYAFNGDEALALASALLASQRTLREIFTESTRQREPAYDPERIAKIQEAARAALLPEERP